MKYRRKARGGHGLRATIARAIRADIKFSGEARVSIRTFSRYLPRDQRNLPRYLDRTKGWRHPVFANRERWVDQFGQPWFSVTLIKHGPKVRRQVIEAIDRTLEQITKG